MNKYNLISENPYSTVVAEYTPTQRSATDYQSEAALEQAFIDQLRDQAYEYVTFSSEEELVANLRCQLEKLNNYTFSDNEWNKFFTTAIANQTDNIEDKTAKIQEEHIQLLTRDNGETKNIRIIDKEHIHNNTLQVTNQYENTGERHNRYDVTILVNGLPLIHIELKRRGVDIKEAFNQIARYQRESFWAGHRLFEYVQLFIISNGTYTKYYSNTTRKQHKQEQKNSKTKNTKKTSHSFEFTSWWADAHNQPITELTDFTKTFFAKHTILNILTRYCVFTSERLLLVMRPYQIVTTEKILNRIETSTNMKQLGTTAAGGYIWHTTGSGKTLTSFKTAQLASNLDHIDKVIFVVDRKDLDYQTMKEYDKFEKGAANSNTSTSVLQKQLENTDARIIITTIQKLDKFVHKNPNHELYKKHCVLIFDECHRSQFGLMHKTITKAFKKYNIFGFTGTPIFPTNSTAGGDLNLKTTEQAFGEKLHTYTIIDAINDKNVLRFRVDYVNTVQPKEEITDQKVKNIDTEKLLNHPQRIANVVQYIREHFNQKTLRNDKSYTHTAISNIQNVASTKDRHAIEEIKTRIQLSGFNSIFAVSSIETAKQYYAQFKKQQADIPEISKLKVALIYSFGVNENGTDSDGLEDENSESTQGLDSSSRDFLDSAIKDYNHMFGVSYDTSSEQFQSYYKDISMRMKNREIDLLIVVNMFLTGFDATTLNTLWVDKNLRQHGLLQAFSRTNRILNSIKAYGNIVTFRDLEKETNEALALFGNKDARGVVLLRPFNDYYYGYDDGEKTVKGYEELIAELIQKYPIGPLPTSEKQQKEFIGLYGKILKLQNILSTFDEFEDKKILSERDIQNYHGMYIELYRSFREENQTEKIDVSDDVIFEMELIKQVDINIDYILELVAKYNADNQKDKDVLADINRAIGSSLELRNKKDLILQFVDRLNVDSDVTNEWQRYISEKKVEELNTIIAEENLNAGITFTFMESALKDGTIPTTGALISEILPPISRFDEQGTRTATRERVFDKLTAFFNRFFDV